jgi:hypothetical protein
MEFDERWNGASIDEEHWHFHRQLLERYHFVMGPGDFSDLIHAIRTGRATKVRPMSRGRALYRYRVKSNGRLIFVLASRYMVFTAWPLTKELRDMPA